MLYTKMALLRSSTLEVTSIRLNKYSIASRIPPCQSWEYPSLILPSLSNSNTIIYSTPSSSNRFSDCLLFPRISSFGVGAPPCLIVFSRTNMSSLGGPGTQRSHGDRAPTERQPRAGCVFTVNAFSPRLCFCFRRFENMRIL